MARTVLLEPKLPPKRHELSDRVSGVPVVRDVTPCQKLALMTALDAFAGGDELQEAQRFV